MMGIYKITSPSGRIYIGQTINSDKRFKKYSYLNCKKQPRLYNSFLKYDYKNHVIEIIEECDFDKLNERERYWQDFYNVLSEKGLNCTLTETKELPKVRSVEYLLNMSNAQKGKKHSQETIEKLRVISSMYKHSEESKLKISNSHKGKKFSEEHIKNMSLSRLGKKKSKEFCKKRSELTSGSNNPRAKKVKCSLTNKTWNCLKDASIELNISYNTLRGYMQGKHPNKTTLIYYNYD